MMPPANRIMCWPDLIFGAWNKICSMNGLMIVISYRFKLLVGNQIIIDGRVRTAYLRDHHFDVNHWRMNARISQRTLPVSVCVVVRTLFVTLNVQNVFGWNLHPILEVGNHQINSSSALFASASCALVVVKRPYGWWLNISHRQGSMRILELCAPCARRSMELLCWSICLKEDQRNMLTGWYWFFVLIFSYVHMAQGAASRL